MCEHQVFVYGTLKQTHSNRLSKLVHAQYLGEDILGPGFIMLDLGAFPAVVFTQPGGCVRGEVWGVDSVTLRMLDIYEDYPNLYQRCTVSTRFGDALMYHMPHHHWLADAKMAKSNKNVYIWD